jgi:hypothetical protein
VRFHRGQAKNDSHPFHESETQMVGGRMFWIIGIGSLGLMAAAACGSSRATTTGQATGAAAPTATVSMTPSPAPPSASPAPTPHPVDVAAAKKSALALFVKFPLVLNDPQAGYGWSGGPSSASHMSAQVNTRFGVLQRAGFFSDAAGGCGIDYISHTQNGLFIAPVVVSAIPSADGSVTVVIHRQGSGGVVLPNLTPVMTDENGSWLATDLASGTGAAASIFSAKPNC